MWQEALSDRVKEEKVEKKKKNQHRKSSSRKSTQQVGKPGTEPEGKQPDQDSLFTPFFPFLSFLYCSFSWAIRLWSTSQPSSPRAAGSSFSVGQNHQNQNHQNITAGPTEREQDAYSLELIIFL